MNLNIWGDFQICISVLLSIFTKIPPLIFPLEIFDQALYTEAATGWVLWKKMFLEISQNSQEKETLAQQSLFFKNFAGAAYNFIKTETLAQVFSCEFCEISKNNFFTEHLQTTTSVHTPLLRELLKIKSMMKRFLLAHFQATFHFYFHTPIRNRRFSDVFRRYRKEALVETLFIFFDLKCEEHLFQNKIW